MEAAALVEQGGEQINVGYTVLDITKHALKELTSRQVERERFPSKFEHHQARAQGVF